MKNRRPQQGNNAAPGGKIYRFRLFVVGNESNSAQARKNLVQLCEAHLKGRCEIQIVDVLQDPDTALKNKVMATPALMLVGRRPAITVLGNLSDSGAVLAALGMAGES